MENQHQKFCLNSFFGLPMYFEETGNLMGRNNCKSHYLWWLFLHLVKCYIVGIMCGCFCTHGAKLATILRSSSVSTKAPSLALWAPSVGFVPQIATHWAPKCLNLGLWFYTWGAQMCQLGPHVSQLSYYICNKRLHIPTNHITASHHI